MIRLTIGPAAFGAFLGFGARILAARTEGANIGGGVLLLLTPIVTTGVAAYWYLIFRRVTQH
jgi:hypothetical protein